MKNKLFWIFVIIGLVVLIVGLVVLIVYLVLENEATWVIAAFTVVLAVTTIWNAKITQGLLRQSRQASDIDTFNKILHSTLQLNAELRAAGEKFPQNERTAYIENSVIGMLIALNSIDSTALKKIGEIIEIWDKTDSRTPATTFSKTWNRIKGLLKKKEFTNEKNSNS